MLSFFPGTTISMVPEAFLAGSITCARTPNGTNTRQSDTGFLFFRWSGGSSGLRSGMQGKGNSAQQLVVVVCEGTSCIDTRPGSDGVR
jgi:hypothetical protein